MKSLTARDFCESAERAELAVLMLEVMLRMDWKEVLPPRELLLVEVRGVVAERLGRVGVVLLSLLLWMGW